MNNKGFTLVEVITVVAIIALLGVITVPSILNTLDTGRNTSDKVLYNNIKTSLQTMYEEIDYTNSEIYNYDTNGKTSTKITITSNTINTNIQTLVSNGFLTGIKNNDTTSNKNLKIVLNSKNEDLGKCSISITKHKDGNKIYYEITSNSSYDYCPKTEDFGG